MLKRRSHFGTVWTPDGRIYAIGGSNYGNQQTKSQHLHNNAHSGSITPNILSSVEEYTFFESLRMYNTQSLGSHMHGYWRQVAPLPSPANISSAIYFRDVILVCGYPFAGLDSYAPSPVTDIHGQGQWTKIPTIIRHIPLIGQCVFLVASSDCVYGFSK